MANLIKLRKGLDLRLKGVATNHVSRMSLSAEYAVCPDDFVGVRPRVLVQAGQTVRVGEPLFENKLYPEVKFTSPVSGTVKEVRRGDRRKVLAILIEPDKEQQYLAFPTAEKTLADGSAQEIKNLLLESGLFGLFRQLPYDISALPDAEPKGIFVSAFRDMPLAADFEQELKGNEAAFKAGLQALSKLAPVHLGVSSKQKAATLTKAKDVDLNVFDGPCPAGNASVQVNHIDPVNKGEVVWLVDPMTVVFIGRLFTTGQVDFHRLVAVAGSCVTNPQYVDTVAGAPLKDLLEGNLVRTDHVRIINGNPLTGTRASLDGYLSMTVSEVAVIPEGDNVDELFGWIMPRPKMFSTSRSYVSWLTAKKRRYDFDARVKGSERHMIMSGEYDRVFPMDIYPEYLIKAIIADDIDKQEQLGIYEVSPADFALAEFVDSSKLELQRIVREGLDTLRKENE